MQKLLNRTRRPDITFCRNGRVFITARVTRLLSLRPKDVINVAVEGNECLLYVVNRDNTIGRHAASCYPSNKHSRYFRANSSELCRAVLSISKVRGDRASFMVGAPTRRNDTVFLPIISHRPL